MPEGAPNSPLFALVKLYMRGGGEGAQVAAHGSLPASLSTAARGGDYDATHSG